MTPGSSARDGEIEALVVDRYLESLLARRPRDVEDLRIDLRETADLIAGSMPRYHPSFRFEEGLATRLAAAAAAGPAVSGHASADPIPADILVFPAIPDARDARDPRTVQVRPVVIGGVLTSAAISLAGAAYVAWRRGRPPGDPMARAARAIARARTV